MPRASLQSLGRKIKEKRGEKGIREAAEEVGVSTATLSRVERGYLPDLENFTRICKWLQLDPGEVLGFKNKPSSQNTRTNVAVHFRKDREIKPETAKALSNMIIAAQQWMLDSED